jgi:hypothetical protein
VIKKFEKKRLSCLTAIIFERRSLPGLKGETKKGRKKQQLKSIQSRPRHKNSQVSQKSTESWAFRLFRLKDERVQGRHLRFSETRLAPVAAAGFVPSSAATAAGAGAPSLFTSGSTFFLPKHLQKANTHRLAHEKKKYAKKTSILFQCGGNGKD